MFAWERELKEFEKGCVFVGRYLGNVFFSEGDTEGEKIGRRSHDDYGAEMSGTCGNHQWSRSVVEIREIKAEAASLATEKRDLRHIQQHASRDVGVRQDHLEKIKKMAESPFKCWDKVEVKMLDEGEFQGGTYGGVIMGIWLHRYEIKLTTLTDSATGRPMRVSCGWGALQPVPPRVLVEYKPFDMVEVWYKRGWWPVTVLKVTDQKQCIVKISEEVQLFVESLVIAVLQALVGVRKKCNKNVRN
ncbi:hypothetical protein L2E82_17096 [Cichorium intybus]|uniref:Uncharacterized protein n=1 Tax=Cichorium intybus TaxID=13427 RepID=A0ACB9F802_CICIN|nr:hypothetical protein L2E82_17096 [Cichorium intybus]